MGKSKAVAQKFQKINKSGLKLKNSGNRSRTGQSTSGRVKAHKNMKMA
jgi:hypothetical protein